jgi:flagellar motor switch protein FliG
MADSAGKLDVTNFDKDLSGPEKSAILLMSIGEERAAQVLKHLGPKEVQQIGIAMAGTRNVPKEQIEVTLAEFLDTVGEQMVLGVSDTDEFIRTILIDALGEDKGGAMLDRILIGGNTQGLESLKWMDARSIAELVRLEHPQIIALVLSYIEDDQAAGVIQEFPEGQRADILLRVATVGGVQPAAITELNEMLERQLKGGTTIQSSTLGGVKTAANILNNLDSSITAKIMEQVKDVDAVIGQQIEDLMFIFDDLIEVDDRSIQILLREVSSDSLVVALKGSDEKVRDKFFRNMSTRAADILREDMEVKGPVRLSQVEQMQKEILATARRLAEEGQINLMVGKEKMV